jgi:preprotein translocase subunit SecF
MELFNPDSNVDFMGARKITAVFSIILFCLSIASLAFYGLKMGLDFTGGTQIEVSYTAPADLENIRGALSNAGFPDAVVQSYGSSNVALLSIAPRADLTQTQLVSKVMGLLPGAKQERVEFVGPQVGKELASKGAMAIIVSLLGTMMYIAMRFEYRFAVSSTAALIHDPLLILGIFSYFQIEFDLKVLAAMLAVIGYSLNDTIVVFDRVRENFRKIRREEPLQIMNISINQTLSRTIMTSVLTLIVLLALFIYGGETLRGFSLAFIIGIVVGTYSSIYVAGALAISLGLTRADLMPTPREELDERP